MHDLLLELFKNADTWLLLIVVAASIAVLGKSADNLVDQAVVLSVRSGMPRVIIGATIVSLGTTMPEATVSVFAAMTGNSEMALGNAVGPVICDTGLILGIACLISPLPLDRKLVNRQGWVQFSVGVLMVLACVDWAYRLGMTDQRDPRLHQYTGIGFLCLLFLYLAWSVRLAKTTKEDGSADIPEGKSSGSAIRPVVILLIAIAFLVSSSATLITAAEIVAERLHVPPAIIAATLVAFGTSLPELVTAITAVRKGQGELAVGNVIGADILNVLFVAGAAASVTPAGLDVPAELSTVGFPAMIIILGIFRVGVFSAKSGKLSRPFGVLLLAVYVIFLAVNILSGGTSGPAK